MKVKRGNVAAWSLLLGSASVVPIDPAAAQSQALPTQGAGNAVATSQNDETAPDQTAVGDAASAPALDDILVTARRRSERAQSVPIAITTITPAVIKDNNIATVQDLQLLVPSLSVTTGNVGQRDSANVAIRGQGYGSIAGQPAVALYLNEVPLPTDRDGQQPGGPGLLFDLENVQVLKGPQGTLFGRNTSGGAVLLQTARPKNDFGGRLQVGGGNYNNAEIDGALNIPIIDDRVLARVAFNAQRRDGFSRSLGTPRYPNGTDLDNRSFYSVRGTLTLKPTTSLQNDFFFTYTRYDSHGSADFLVDIDPDGPAAAAYPTALELVRQQRLLGPRTQLPIGVDESPTYGSLLAIEDILRADIGSGLTIRNLFGYHRALFDYRADVDGTVLPIFDVIDDRYPVEQISDEIQLLGSNFGGRFNWIIGGFFSDQGPPDRSFFPRLALRVLTPTATSPANVDFRRQLLAQSQALFGQGTYDLSSFIAGLKLTGGLRYTWDQRRDSSRSNGVTSGLPQSSSALTYTAGLDYQAARNTLLYVTTRRGYRAGGSTTASNGVNFPFGPEYVTDYEVGLKSDWDVGSVQIRTNVDGYYQNYSSIQVNQLIPYAGQPGGLNVTSNAGTARLWGVELEAQAVLTKQLQIGINYSYLNFDYTSFGPGVDAAALRAGQTANRIPHQVGANLRYDLPFNDSVGKVSFRATYHWQAGFGDFLGTRQIPSYDVVNLALNWDNAMQSPFNAQLFVSNVTNRTYETGGIGFLGFTERTYGDPRLFGFRLSYHFGGEKR